MSGDSLQVVSGLNGSINSADDARGTPPERRQRARTRLHLPLVIFRAGSAASAVESMTRDLSSSGFYCMSRVQFTIGEQLICSLKLPTHDPAGRHLERNLECTVRVMRVIPQESGSLFGIACRIEDYHVSQAGSVDGSR
jgi:hypothetical protein